MPILGLNIDHVATLRQARRTYEPDPVWAAVEAQLAGVRCITMHLREDRRHVQDQDLFNVKKVCQGKLNLEMAATPEMVAIAEKLRPHMCTLVPEGRQEVTTEGGLDVAGQLGAMRDVVAQLRGAGIDVSAFVDADAAQIDASAEAGFQYCEVHTGPYAEAFDAWGGDLEKPAVARELSRVFEAGRRIVSNSMRFNAGHALNYRNTGPIAAMSQLRELHIGHAVVARSVFVGIREAVGEMIQLIGASESSGGMSD